MAERAAGLADFLATHGWGSARQVPLAADASTRRYFRLSLDSRRAIAMDSPPGGVDDTASFVRIARHLRGLGLASPQILAEDVAQGFLLLEDLGDDLYARRIAALPACEAPLFVAAARVLARVQSRPAPADLPNLSAADWADAALLALSHYAAAVTGTSPDPGPLRAALAEALATHADGPRVLILRDFHAENLLWLPRRHGLMRVGLLDFQLAQMGQPVYDLVSMVQDARRNTSAAATRAALSAFADRSGTSMAQINKSLPVLGAQRALRIIGNFARLCLNDGKPGYLRHMPRLWEQLSRNIASPDLADVARIVAAQIPPPTPAILAQMEARCPRLP